MVGVNTARNDACVIQVQPLWYRAFVFCIHKPMSVNVLAVDVEGSIPFGVSAAYP